MKLPSVCEQTEIISLIHKVLEKETEAKTSAENIIVKIDEMKKSILAKAFRGELGTNDPSEEPVAISDFIAKTAGQSSGQRGTYNEC